jgi:hypothetical protein
MHYAGSPLNGHIIVEKAKSFNDKMQITVKCTLSDGWP